MKTRSVQRKSSRSVTKLQKKNNDNSKKMDFREVILLQSIICSILLFLGLMLNNNSVFVTNLISNVKISISDNSLFVNTRESITSILDRLDNNYFIESSNLRIDEEVLYEINKRNNLRNITYDEKK